MLIQNVLGSIVISKDAISKIIGKTTTATMGIASMSSGVVKGITNKLSGKSLQNGIELHMTESGLDVNLSIVIHYGARIYDVCRELQRNVRKSIEKYTGLSIGIINVKVQGISLSVN
ncbi:Asp23/Gls24 family envelope stress response protein [Paenibacillus anaericanus]|uniref:Asp23/Gls24 family envelope stress response protein n=1 Tax=Paenibacillus anaericanus TaxID=170367 RepID=A0A3S1EDP4_9BACL|nr:Asp23/Gls24 family envelope stress response protein [Paenibacillus anaericanus]RUT43429.1 Asp23/Gls24 family envelope stress response protein [Paenibacillus anaericanus]